MPAYQWWANWGGIIAELRELAVPVRELFWLSPQVQIQPVGAGAAREKEMEKARERARASESESERVIRVPSQRSES